MKSIILTAALAFGLLANATNVTTSSFAKQTVVENQFKKKVNPFCMSVSQNDIATVKKLLKLGEDVNKYSGGMSPLMYAARYNRVDMIKLLVKHGAKLKARDAKGVSVLEHAKRSGANEAVALINKLIKEKKKNKKKRK